ncbi:phytase esterase-like protein [Psychromonas sp. psych-6C06]|uniref:esterase-like activity of phytase family protein n=1 Tax=Psychromonas sp. psych-6C06 TaxID=2058089 RepID=UPI000C343571|nr:esterase-like activity of phytase family protein [Psychromonas sp. psych-6C06]PKF63775.1 phytase esterase-like protein [Psychromonas sp. psych-6C06]
MNVTKIFSALYLALACSACAMANNVANEHNTQATSGAMLPYTVLRDDLKNHAKGIEDSRLEIRNGGYGSDMTAHPHIKNQFYALTDRGPNATYKKGALGKGKIFPVADYTPRIGLFELQGNGSIKQLKTILLKRPDGTPITGLPNSSAFGGTGETPYTATGKPIVEDMALPFDAEKNPIKLDDFGLDGEGLVALKDGSFWVSDEYGPHLVHFDSQGIEIGRINPFVTDSRAKLNLPAEFANRRPNRGMEGLAVTQDQATLIGTMQSTMFNPNKKVKKLNLVRLVTVNLKTQKIQQFIYQQEKNQNANSGIATLSDSTFLVIERDGRFLRDTQGAMKHIYRIDISEATDLESIANNSALKQDDKLGLLINGQTLEQAVFEHGWKILEAHDIKPVSKTLVVDLVKAVNYPHDKLEGMWLRGPHSLAVVNDDDFATWSKKGKLTQKYLDKARQVIDSSQLYILDNLSLKSE